MSDTPRHDRNAAALGQLLALTVLMNDDLTIGLAERGLTPARAPVVWELLQHGPRTQRQLAGALGVTPRNITGLVDALVETGFVTREPHPTDRRATQVTLTRHGQQVTGQMSREADQLADDLFGDLTDDQLSSLGSGLERLVRRLTTLIEEARA